MRLVLAFCLAATPVFAEDAPAVPPVEDDGFSLMEEGMKLVMRGMMSEMQPAFDEMGKALEEMETQSLARTARSSFSATSFKAAPRRRGRHPDAAFIFAQASPPEAVAKRDSRPRRRYQRVNVHGQPLENARSSFLSIVDSYPFATRIRSRISFAAAGILVPGPKIAFTPTPFRNS